MLAKNAKSPNSILESLSVADIPITSVSRDFADQLYAKFPRQEKSEALRKKAMRETTELLAKNQSYSLIEEPESPIVSAVEESFAGSGKKIEKGKKLMDYNDSDNEYHFESKKNKTDRKRSVRKKDENYTWEDDETVPIYNSSESLIFQKLSWMRK